MDRSNMNYRHVPYTFVSIERKLRYIELYN